MTQQQKVENIVAFFSIIFRANNAAWNEVMKLSPEYIIEKFERYVMSSAVEYPWGIHSSL